MVLASVTARAAPVPRRIAPARMAVVRFIRLSTHGCHQMRNAYCIYDLA
jgi:hypothetical protein